MGGYIPRQPGDPSRSAIKQPCTGEAHSNAYIDNCMSCAPHWGYYYTCPSCTGKIDPSKTGYFGTCRNEDCLSYKERFSLPR
jgi:hypothetical protein